MTGSPLSDSGKRLAPPLRRLAQFEGGILVAVLAAMVALPVLSVAARLLFGFSSAAPNLWVQHLNLVLAFVGAVIAARTGRHPQRLCCSDLWRVPA